jgi:succinate-semialdehyde dehydrogenase / glutarate-semialdehyde dehydrogenase
LNQYTLGDQMGKNVNYGPLARVDLAKHLQEQLDKTISMGAKVLKSGGLIRADSSLFETVVLSEIPENSPAYKEELFGPVASLFSVKNFDEAITLANSSPYGLGASIWTADESLASKIAGRLSNGCVYVNQMMFSHPAIPFGGVKMSGYGRELSLLGLKEFANQQTIWMA